MRLEVDSILVGEMLEAYRKTLTTREESELLGAPLKIQQQRLRQVVPELINAYLEVELHRMAGPVRGAFFDVFVSAPGEMRVVGSVSKRRRA
jgi:hypothetical protein